MNKVGYKRLPNFDKKEESIIVVYGVGNQWKSFYRMFDYMHDASHILLEIFNNKMESSLLSKKRSIEKALKKELSTERYYRIIRNLTNIKDNQRHLGNKVLSALDAIGILSKLLININISIEEELVISRQDVTGKKFIIIGPEDDYVAYGFSGNIQGQVEYIENEFNKIIQKFIS